MSTSASSGMDVSSAVGAGVGIGMGGGTELQLDAGPSTLTSTHAHRPSAKHVEVENWDDDFADEDNEEGEESFDDDEPVAGPSTSAFSPRSVKSSRVVQPRELEGHGDGEDMEEDEDESWDEDEEDEEEEEEQDESWDEDDEDEDGEEVVDEGRVGLVPAVMVEPPAERSDVSTSRDLDAVARPALLSVPPSSTSMLPPSSTSPLSSSLLPPTTSTQPVLLPPPTLPFSLSPTSSVPSATAHTSTSSSSSSSPLAPPAPPTSSLSSPPTSFPLPTPISTQTDDLHLDEFGSKPRSPEHGDAEHEIEDEDATITARSRHSRAKTRLSTGVNAPPPVPSLPTLPTGPAASMATCFAPPSSPPTTTSSSTTAPGEKNVDRGEGPSRRAPVFSPPVAHTSTSSATTTPSSTASPSKTPRRTIRPRTADSSLSTQPRTFQLHSKSGSQHVQVGEVGVVPRARGSLDAVRTFESAAEARDNANDAFVGPTRVRRDALGGTGAGDGVGGNLEPKIRAGMWTRLGQGVSRWAGSSNATSNSTSTSNVDGAATSRNGTRGRGRSNTVTGASMLSVAAPPHPPPTTATTTNGPTVVVEAAPRASFASARPSTSSSSSSNPGKATLRPRPTTNATATTSATSSQRNSIASLLSIRTYRSRTSSVSASGSVSRTPSGTTSGHGHGPGSSSGHGHEPRQSIDESEEAPPRSSMSSWTQRLFNGSSGGGAEGRARQSVEGTRPSFGAGVGVGGAGGAGRRSMGVIGCQLAAGPITDAGRGEKREAGGGVTNTQAKGVLGFLGRRKRSNTVSALSPPPPASNASGPDDKETQTEVYANKKASKSQRSLQALLGRRPSALGRPDSVQGKRGGRVVAKVDGKEGQKEDGKDVAKAGEEGSATQAVPVEDPQAEQTTESPVRGTKRSIVVAGRTSLPLAPPTRSGSEPTVGTQPVDGAVRPSPSKHLHSHSHTRSQSTSRSTSHSTSNSLSSIGELKIPSRISQAQVSIRRDLGLVKEFAGKVAELKDLQGSYLKMIESVQGMIDSDNGQPIALVKTSRPRSNTSPALSRPPSKSPLASLFQCPDASSNASSTNATPSPVTPATPATSAAPPAPSTPSPLATPLYNSADLVQRMADITARYDSWWECAELLIELGNTPPSVPTPVSTVRLTPPTSIFVAPPPPASPGPPPPTPTATVAAKSRGDAYGALSSASAASTEPNSLTSSSTSNHVGPAPKPTRGRANTFAGNMPVARLRSASTSTASITHGGHVQSLSTSSSSSSTAPSHTWRATTGRHDLSQRQLVLLREMLGVDQKPQVTVPRRPSAMSAQTHIDDAGEDDLDADSDGEDATWRWGHANTVQLPSPAEEKEAYFGIPTRKPGHRPWNRAYHQSAAPSDDEDHGQEVYVVEPAETKKSKGMNAIRDMLRTLKCAHPPTPTTPSFPMSAEAPPVLSAAPAISPHAPLAAAHGTGSLSPAQHTIRRAASLLPLSSGPSARVPSSSSTMSRASKIDPALAFSMTPENIKPLLDNAREVTERLGECVADVRALLASAGVEAVAVGDS